jgi:hypothetical protein
MIEMIGWKKYLELGGIDFRRFRGDLRELDED